jgi:hypothetical protein
MVSPMFSRNAEGVRECGRWMEEIVAEEVPKKAKASRSVTASRRSLDRTDAACGQAHPGTDGYFHRSIPSAAWRPFLRMRVNAPGPEGEGPKALRRRLSTGMPFRG